MIVVCGEVLCDGVVCGEVLCDGWNVVKFYLEGGMWR